MKKLSIIRINTCYLKRVNKWYLLDTIVIASKSIAKTAWKDIRAIFFFSSPLTFEFFESNLSHQHYVLSERKKKIVSSLNNTEAALKVIIFQSFFRSLINCQTCPKTDLLQTDLKPWILEPYKFHKTSLKIFVS